MKEIRFSAEGPRALSVLKSVGYPMAGVYDKFRCTHLLLRAQKKGLALTRMKGITEETSRGRTRISTYCLIDLDSEISAVSANEVISKKSGNTWLHP